VPHPRPPLPRPDAALSLAGERVDLGTRVLVAGVVPSPRFGREAEVAAGAAAMRAAGVDLVDVPLPPRLVGPVARGEGAPVAVRAGTVDEALAAGHAGAAVVLVPAELVADVLAATAAPGGPSPATVAVVDDLGGLGAARDAATAHGVPLAFDATPWAGAEAVARESAAVLEGCRLLRTTDVRRSRRIAAAMTALLEARRPAVWAAGGRPGEDGA
jgi:hypothetical protein